MIMTVAELKQFIATDAADLALEGKLRALELLVRAYTNNNFQVRAFRSEADLFAAGKIIIVTERQDLFSVGDTLEISESDLMNGCLVTVASKSGGTLTTKENLYNEEDVSITKVEYPVDIKLGVANMVQWDLTNRDKVGVSSETISRHSVTYYNMDGDNSIMGYPKSLMGFLKPYMKARFGRGVHVC